MHRLCDEETANGESIGSYHGSSTEFANIHSVTNYLQTRLSRHVREINQLDSTVIGAPGICQRLREVKKTNFVVRVVAVEFSQNSQI